MSSKETIFNFTEDSQSNACFWDVRCADYKNRNKQGDATDFMAKRYEVSTDEVTK
jgi:hypothetical protein